MNPGSSTESYPAFAHIGLRENPGKTSTRHAEGGQVRADGSTVGDSGEDESGLRRKGYEQITTHTLFDSILHYTNTPPQDKRQEAPRLATTSSEEDQWQVEHVNQRTGILNLIYEEYPRANSWVSTKKNLSSSEYTNAIKMSCNLTAMRYVPGRAFSTTRCRQPSCNETETLGHVLGFCRKGELLRNDRHHRVRGAIACILRNKG
ncbi:hypothetical protein ANN_13381 [Periplaneta americana]|uniref:Reverse transcriptase n=1 Tax=Periplaneta americana TaxID=6978 RepID=A0ABQ8TJR1_PERAM|nr:hypothetical protein ANN_13381 [Periplaneta americana]